MWDASEANTETRIPVPIVYFGGSGNRGVDRRYREGKTISKECSIKPDAILNNTVN